MKKIAVSLGDINGVGIEIALKSHDIIKQFCEPVYFINRPLLEQACKLLNSDITSDFTIIECGDNFKIKPGKVSKKSGKFSFLSFQNAALFSANSHADALLTLPINKEAWKKARVPYIGHTDALGAMFNKHAIMMLGCDELFVALFSDHIALKNVSKKIKTKALKEFLLTLYADTKFTHIGVLGFNPHASDNGTIGGGEEKQIKKAIKSVNSLLKKDIFFGPIVPDAAFNPNSLKNCNRLVAMYHDGGLAALKALYFDKSINVSLNLPIVRVSVDHGTAYDIAYKGIASNESYIQAAKFALNLAEKRKESCEFTKNS